ncbi:RND family efflux transporter, MFP subunit [Singulisphaera sp. GP187]|uniref:efflux RND transporter periplasmic adaptor subunit n=1 Tax=Singulisphaera sp. GP187 TaxID=1882752 RepID=UPI00092C705D|nr:efflux RND transporter periplasmic adaptor subunit [Singulisphaera sp. GP187]SIO56047.1 RND family efflux transporter, MFP subunit [Singulisphaera sp. GP187]
MSKKSSLISKHIRTLTKPSRSSLATLSLLALFLAGCGESTAKAPAHAVSAAAPPIARVTTVTPERMTIRRISEQPGQIEAAEVTAMYAKLAGYLETVSADIGDRVKKGQVMAELRVPEVEADLKQKRALIDQAQAEKRQAEATVSVALARVLSAEAKVSETKAGIRRAEADVARWQAEFTRVQQLAHERALTGSLVDETRSKVGAAEASRDEVQAQVKSNEALVAEAKAELDKTRSDVLAAAAHVEVARFEAERAAAMASYQKIEAPYDGIVTRQNADTGQLTTPGTTGEPLFVVARSGVVTVSVGVPETDAPFVNVGDPAHVRLLALNDRTFDGKVTRTAWALEPATRTLLTEIDLPASDDALRPGLYAYVTVVAEEHENALTLPATAIVKDGGKTFCVTVADGRAKRTEIKLGLTEGKRTEVVSGLREGERVVEANAGSLTDGQAVEANEPQADTAKPKT